MSGPELTAWQIALFWTRVSRQDEHDCWPWTGYVTPKGYGRFGVGHDATVQAHVLAFTLVRGPVPDGLTLDHVCHTVDSACPRGADCQHRRCCNPFHMEPVSREENTRRGRAPDGERARARTRCAHGHELTDDNTLVRGNGYRECRTCNRLRARRSTLRRKAAAGAH